MKAETLSTVDGGGDEGCIGLNSDGIDSSQDGDEKGHVPEARSDVDEDIGWGERGHGCQMKDVADGGGLVEDHLGVRNMTRFFRGLKLQDAGDEFIEVVVAEPRNWSLPGSVAERFKQFGRASSLPDLCADGCAGGGVRGFKAGVERGRAGED